MAGTSPVKRLDLSAVQGSQHRRCNSATTQRRAMFSQASSVARKLQEDGARPMIYHNRAATCWYPQVKGLTVMVNSVYNGSR